MYRRTGRNLIRFASADFCLVRLVEKFRNLAGHGERGSLQEEKFKWRDSHGKKFAWRNTQRSTGINWEMYRKIHRAIYSDPPIRWPNCNAWSVTVPSLTVPTLTAPWSPLSDHHLRSSESDRNSGLCRNSIRKTSKQGAFYCLTIRSQFGQLVHNVCHS